MDQKNGRGKGGKPPHVGKGGKKDKSRLKRRKGEKERKLRRKVRIEADLVRR